MIIKKSDYCEIGGFDENIFMYAEDLDLCYRLQEVGKGSYIYDSSSIYHLHGVSGDKKKVSLKKLLATKQSYYYVLSKNKMISRFGINIAKVIYAIHASILVAVKKIM